MAATATEAAGPGAPAPEGLSVRQAGFLVAVLVLSVLTGVMHYAGVGAVATFIVAGVALGGLAWAIGFATEAVADRFGPAVTGVLQSTLGNLPELFVVLFALRAGEIVVAQTSIIGSLFANALLVLGLTILAGARYAPDGVMRYSKRLPNDTATLLLLAVFIIVLLGLSNEAGDPASRHQEAISAIGAVCLLIVYAFWLWGYLRGAPTTEAARGHAEAGAPAIGLAPAVGLLALSGARRRAGLGVVRGRARPGRPRAGRVQGVHRPGHRRHRGQRGRALRGHLAGLEGQGRAGHLGGQELRGPDRGVPVPGAGAAVVLLRHAADLRRSRRSTWGPWRSWPSRSGR